MLRKSDEAYTRMLEEMGELQGRIDRLDKMVQDCRHHRRSDITLEELHLMEEQLSYMRQYSYTLSIRISRVKE